MFLFDGTLNLYPNESCVITGSQQLIKTINKKEYNNIIEIESKVQLLFAEATKYPDFTDLIEIDQFIDINKFIKPDFAGTIRYKMNFYLSKDVESIQIELDQVYEIAEIFIDNTRVGTKIVEPYIFIINSLCRGKHELIIDVTNTMDKKIKDLFSQNEPVKPSGLLKKPIIKY